VTRTDASFFETFSRLQATDDRTSGSAGFVHGLATRRRTERIDPFLAMVEIGVGQRSVGAVRSDMRPDADRPMPAPSGPQRCSEEPLRGAALFLGALRLSGPHELLAERCRSITHNPLSNFKLRSGICPVRQLIDAKLSWPDRTTRDHRLR
jgi:hypothetical protein